METDRINMSQIDIDQINTEQKDCYKFGTFVFEIRHGGKISFPPFLERFREEEVASLSQSYELVLTDCLPVPQGCQIAHRADLDVYAISDSDIQGGAVRETRLLRFVGAKEAYGYYEECGEHQSRVYLQREFLPYASIDTVFYSLFALERHLLTENGVILHCAMLRVGSEALLFSGPSGIGKSTHASLWQTHVPDAEIINGDRALLQWVDGQLMAHSWCVSGSSGICLNQSLPVRGIIFLRQELENGGAPLRDLGAVKRLVSQITVNHWNPQAVERVWELAEQMARDAAIYEYGCNMQPEAVTELARILGMHVQVEDA